MKVIEDRYVVKLSSKGQLVLPKEVREDMEVHPGDILILKKDQSGFWKLEKGEILAFRELSQKLQEEAKKKGYTEEELEKDVEKAREEVFTITYNAKNSN
jgi:AbrB family looped-hinge helix DNA binding protein